MKLVSKAALGAVLALGSLSMTAAMPAYAAKEKKPKKGEAAAAAPAGPKLTLTKDFITKLTPAIDASKAQNWPAAKAALDAVEPLATTPDERYQLNDMRLGVGVALKDASIQAQAVDGMLATGLVLPTDKAKFQYFAGKWAYERKDYTRAETELKNALAGGFVNSDVYFYQARLYADSTPKRPTEASAALYMGVEEELKAGRKPPEAWYNFGLTQSFNAKSMPQYTKWTTNWLKAYPTSDNWRTVLQNYRSLAVNVSADKKGLGGRIDLDLFRLMRATKALAGENDNYDYAYIANASGLPLEAQTVINDWKAANGQKLSADMTELSGKVVTRANADRASLATLEKGPAIDAAPVVMASGNYAKAATLYQAAIAKGGLKDAEETQMQLGIALAMSGQKEPARAAFQTIKGKRADLAQYWMLYLDSPLQAAAPMTMGQ